MINDKRRDDILYLIRYIQKKSSQDLDKRLAEYGLTGVQGRILFFIAKKTNIDKIDVHQNDIENEFHLSKSTVSGLVRRMEKNGFITIAKQHPYAILTPSEKGQDVICHLLSNREDFEKRFFKDVSKEQKKQLKEILLILINNMEGGSQDVEKD